MLKKKGLLLAAGGFLIGVINGLLGAGGGMLAVPLLSKACGLERQEAHMNSVAVILPITLVSVGVYLFKGSVQLSDALCFVPPGLLGALLGTVALGKIPSNRLKLIFGGFMIWAGIRLVMR